MFYKHDFIIDTRCIDEYFIRVLRVLLTNQLNFETNDH